MRDPIDYEIAQAMRKFGGSFVQRLGEAYLAADDENRRRIRATWPEYFEKYAELASLELERKP